MACLRLLKGNVQSTFSGTAAETKLNNLVSPFFPEFAVFLSLLTYSREDSSKGGDSRASAATCAGPPKQKSFVYMLSRFRWPLRNNWLCECRRIDSRLRQQFDSERYTGSRVSCSPVFLSLLTYSREDSSKGGDGRASAAPCAGPPKQKSFVFLLSRFRRIDACLRQHFDSERYTASRSPCAS